MSNDKTAPLDLARLRELVARATPGPWIVDAGTDILAPPTEVWSRWQVASTSCDGLVDKPLAADDAALIVDAVNALPGLLDELEAARRERDEAKERARVEMLHADQAKGEVQGLRSADKILRADRDRWKERAEAAEREAERWRHGVTIEGDFVCPDSLELAAAQRRIEALESALADSEQQVRQCYTAAQNRDRMQARIEALEKVAAYARCRAWCGMRSHEPELRTNGNECTCGVKDALAAAKETP